MKPIQIALFTTLGLAACGSGEALDTEGEPLTVMASIYRWYHDGQLQPSPVITPALQGRAVAINGLRAAVTNGPVVAPGVDVFERDELNANNWTFKKRLTPVAGTYGLFGTAIAIDGDRIAVGAPYGDWDNQRYGYVDVFVKGVNGWVKEQTLTPAGFDFPADYLQEEFAFGASLDLQGDTLVVGANRYAKGRGRVFVFERSGGAWAQTAIFGGHQNVSDENFGNAVRISGDTIAVGCPGLGVPPLVIGAVYVFVKSGGAWIEQATLVSGLGGMAADGFASSVDVAGDRIAAVGNGTVQLFVRSGNAWSFAWSDTTPNESGGKARVALLSNRLAVGLSHAQVKTFTGAGSVRIYSGTGSTLSLEATVSDPSPIQNGYFGTSLALSGSYLATAAPGNSTYGGDAQVHLRAPLRAMVANP